MTKKITEKYNDACIKLFSFIIMLYEDRAYFKDVIDLISDGKYDGTSNTHVTLNKYLNALKIFGIKVKKIKNKYHMLSPLDKITFNSEDIKCIKRLKEAADLLPNGSNKQNISTVIKNIEVRYDDTTREIVNLNDGTYNDNSVFLKYDMVEQIKLCAKYCQDKQKLEILYTDSNNNNINIVCTPLETLYLKRQVCLKTIGNNGNRVYEIPIDSIKSIKQLPSAGITVNMPTTIVYRIKNRLAKNYRIREWEKLETAEADGSKIIINKNEDLNTLLRRLMRYSTECEVISPKFFKEEMINLINKTLSNYE
jgi:hypothetical protein